MANQDDTSVKDPVYQLEAHDAGEGSHPIRAHARVYEEEAARVLLVTQALEREARRRLELARETEPPPPLKLD
ncbi:MAG TPA: hypothetical protein VGP77_14665 [Vicinamibacterales bacterium]|jgi:hypothetical protein|nr:hypothetical protein [Vicinamibacterales bacterium]